MTRSESSGWALIFKTSSKRPKKSFYTTSVKAWTTWKLSKNSTSMKTSLPSWKNMKSKSEIKLSLLSHFSSANFFFVKIWLKKDRKIEMTDRQMTDLEMTAAGECESEMTDREMTAAGEMTDRFPPLLLYRRSTIRHHGAPVICLAPLWGPIITRTATIEKIRSHPGSRICLRNQRSLWKMDRSCQQRPHLRWALRNDPQIKSRAWGVHKKSLAISPCG